MSQQTTVVSPYADYSFYTDTYKGSAISEADFERMELRAEEYLDVLTFNRIPDMDESRMNDRLALNIRKACCAIAEAYQRTSPSESSSVPAGIASEKNDGYSISYATRTAQEAEADSASVMKRTAISYIGYSGLLYKGGGDWYDH